MTTADIREQLKKEFKKEYGVYPEEIKELPLSGSSRRYFRVTLKNNRLIGTYNKDLEENKTFFYLQSILKSNGVKVPEIISRNDQVGVYIQEDLGDVNLYDYVQQLDRSGDEEILNIYRKVIDQMPFLQYKSAGSIDFSKCYPREAFDAQSIQWDLNYFKYCFLKLVNIPFHEQKLEDEFIKLIEFSVNAPSDFFLFRDFQSRNIMLNNNDVYFIDFQGGRRGALQYDLASLLFESKINLSPDLRNKLLHYYLKVFSDYSFFDKEVFLKYYPSFALIRILQAFGAYGYRGIFEKKAFFVKSIAQGLNNLAELIKEPDLIGRFPYLVHLISSMQELKDNYEFDQELNGLTVSITSFSYKNGLPDDWSGNGGGHIFDCRALPNPGRQERYRSSTGRDKEVAEYLQGEGEVDEFISTVQNLVDSSVKKYINRGFSHLSISFGCTGGQHRSVYSAQKIYDFLKLNHDVNIRLFHRELNFKEDYGKNNVQKIQ